MIKPFVEGIMQIWALGICWEDSVNFGLVSFFVQRGS